MRAFFAIAMPESTQDSLKQVLTILQHTIPKQTVRWTALGNLHITLQFMQQIQVTHLGHLIENVQLALKNTSSFELELGKIEFFPRISHPRVIALEAGPNTILADLADTIGQGISAVNYPVPTEVFRGHLTLGRVSRAKFQPNSLDDIKLPLIPKVEINQICLFESKPGKMGSQYIPLAHFKFHS
jgi:RNA 2',3'-cyclic 3'-phosphodiesterase